MAFESTEPYQLMEAEGLINISPGKEGKHVVSPWLLSVVQYQLNICINREPFSRKKYSLIFFKFICLDEISVFSSVLEQKWEYVERKKQVKREQDKNKNQKTLVGPAEECVQTALIQISDERYHFKKLVAFLCVLLQFGITQCLYIKIQSGKY